MSQEKVCGICGQSFSVPPSRATSAKFCSTECVRMSQSVTARLTRDVDTSGGPDACWQWKGTLLNGYGQMSVNGKGRLAHRLAWESANGPIPDGLCVCHRCDNPPCCNPAHLFLGTIADNNADKTRKGRQRGPSTPRHRRARGERHGRSRLSERDVAAILQSSESSRSIARRLGVSSSTVDRVRLRKNWAHVNVCEVVCP